jgi:hypothetical protein
MLYTQNLRKQNSVAIILWKTTGDGAAAGLREMKNTHRVLVGIDENKGIFWAHRRRCECEYEKGPRWSRICEFKLS